VELIYRRRLRKLIHILAGLPSFLLAYVSYPIALACALAAVTAAFMLRPEHPWLRLLAKPEDIQQHRISGVRHYFIAVLILIAVFGLHYPLIAAAGWLALAWGDGAAGLVGRKDAMKLPWSSRKTVIGFASCWAGIWLAVVAILFAVGAQGSWTSLSGQAFIGLTALLVSLLESLRLPFDDNYTVGIGAAVLLYGGMLGLHLF
jgi:phytol kinase